MATKAASGTSTPKPVLVSAGTSWSTLLLDLLGAPTTASNYQFVNQWAAHEQADPTKVYANNPFFTSAGAGGTVGPLKAGTYPSIPGHPGLAYYPNIETGDLATALHISSQYPGILAALKSGNAEAYAGNPQLQHDLSLWSGGGGQVPAPAGYSSVTNVGAPSSPIGPTINSTLGIVPNAQGGVTVTGLQQAGIGGWLKKIFVTGPTGTGSIPGVPSNVFGTGLGSIGNLLGVSFPKNPLIRGAEIAGGAVLILLGLILIGTKATSSSPVVQTAGAARTAAGLVK